MDTSESTATAGERPVVARIDLAAVRSNAAIARKHAAGRVVIGVVKADAYGHGAIEIARALIAAGLNALAVVSVAEAEALRSADIGIPILVLGGVGGESEAARARDLRLTIVLHDRPGLDRVRAAHSEGRPAAVEVEVDTGMHRMGVPAAAAADFLAEVEAAAELRLEGAFTHLASADEKDLAPTLAQLSAFRAVLSAASERGVHPGRIHAVNSAGLLASAAIDSALREATAVRPGLMLYGVPPAPHLDPDGLLMPVMTLAGRVVAVRDVAAGEGVGYGATWRAPAPTRVATIPLGYADGIPYSAAGRGQVWIGGSMRPIVGRVSMDYIGVDVGSATGSVVDLGAEAIVFGVAPDGRRIPVVDLAEAAGALSYELLVRVGRRVPRHYE